MDMSFFSGIAPASMHAALILWRSCIILYPTPNILDPAFVTDTVLWCTLVLYNPPGMKREPHPYFYEGTV